ncbi:MAG: Spermidine/putrescine transporter ATP-binding protein, partial [Microbacteriaceae bacterium]|nr:Spermidine/putrescine transporter ATP-binding protein [Microbacteriaceae bacterium]
VISSSFLGSLRRTRVELHGGEFVSIQHETGILLEVGQTVHLRFTGQPVSVAPRTA